MNFGQINEIFDIIQPMLGEFTASGSLKDARIERWRWDQPVIVLSWESTCEPGIRQNLAVSIESAAFDQNSPPYDATVEANAWLDEGTHRHWKRGKQPALKINVITADPTWVEPLRKSLTKAFNEVEGWKRCDLELSPHELKPIPSMS